MHESWEKGGQAVYKWTKEEQAPPIVSAANDKGVTLHPDEVAQEFLAQWGKLWKPGEGGTDRNPWAGKARGDVGLPPITGQKLRAGAKAMGKGKSPGHDGWVGEDFLKLPDEALEELAHLLNGVEQWGAWPAKLRGP